MTDSLRFGAVFPHQIGIDPDPIRAFAQTLEGAGYDYLIVHDHVVGAHPDRFQGPVGGFARPPYTHESPTHEIFTLLSYLAAVTTRLELFTSVLILPQRETLLVAKQAAEVAILSRGRLRLAVGVGWNFAEYEALSFDFHTRGARIEEQVAVLQTMWKEPLVTFDGRWHHLDRIALNPRPGYPIPIWMGSGTRDISLSRVARLAEGWLPLLQSSEDLAGALARLRGYLEQEGRDPASFGLALSLGIGQGTPDDWRRRRDELRALGATHLTVAAGGPGVTIAQQLERLVEARPLLDAG
jgi:probable F420-dependent oxidoreductase